MYMAVHPSQPSLADQNAKGFAVLNYDTTAMRHGPILDPPRCTLYSILCLTLWSLHIKRHSNQLPVRILYKYSTYVHGEMHNIGTDDVYFAFHWLKWPIIDIPTNWIEFPA